MPDVVLTLLTVFGWLGVLIGGVVIAWDAITHRVLNRAGVAAVVVGVVMLILAAVLPVGHVDYNGLHALVTL